VKRYGGSQGLRYDAKVLRVAGGANNTASGEFGVVAGGHVNHYPSAVCVTVGPMAQDFYAAFGVGEDNRHITSIDEEGVTSAAIKALHQRVAVPESKLSELTTLKARLAELDGEIEALHSVR